MPRKKKTVEPVKVTTQQKLVDVFNDLLAQGRTMADIERISIYTNLESEFRAWAETQQQNQTTNT